MATPRKPKSKPKTFDQLLTAALQEQYLEQLREGMRRGAATDVIFGENNATRRKQMRDFIEGDPDFKEKVLDAEVDAREHVEEALYQAAISGSVPAAKTWLELTGGASFPEHRGRPPGPAPGLTGATGPAGDPDGDPLYNVRTLDPRQRRRQSESD